MNTETMIPFGVIAANNLDGDLVDTLLHDSGAVDTSYKQAYADAKLSAEKEFDSLLEDANIAAAETDHHMSDSDKEKFIETFFLKEGHSDFDRESFVDAILEEFSETYQCDEPSIEGTYEGVKYRTFWLGGAMLLWVFHSPWVVSVRSACSPCAPGAGDLDSGLSPNGYLCYGVPDTWMAEPVRTLRFN